MNSTCKIFAVVFFGFVLFSSGALGYSIEPEEAQNITLEAGSWDMVEYEVEMEESIHVMPTEDQEFELDNIDVSVGFEHNEDSYDLMIYFFADGDYDGDEEEVDVNFTVDERIYGSVEWQCSDIDENYIEVTEEGVEYGHEVEVEYMPSEEADSIIETFTVESTINGHGLVEVGDYHNILDVRAEVGDLSYTNRTVQILGEEVPDDIRAEIDITGTEPFDRGDYIPIRIVDNIDRSGITGCTIDVSSGAHSKTIDVSGTTEELKVPEDTESSNFVIEVIDCLEDEYETGYSTTIELESWDDWVSQNRLSLDYEYDNRTGVFHGTVYVDEGDVEEGIAEMEINGNEVDLEDDNGKLFFNYTIEDSGEDYEIDIVRTDMDIDDFNFREEKYLEVDSSGDGVPDHEDECPALEGLPENYGCPEIDVNVRITNKEGKSVSELVVGKVYDIELIDENGTTANISTRIDVGPTRVSIENGEGEFRVDEGGTYTIEGGEDSVRYKEFEAEVTAVTGLSNFISGFWWVPIVIILVLLALFALYKLGGRKETMEDLEQEQIDLTPGEK